MSKSWIVYGEQTIRGYWIVGAETEEEAERIIMESGPALDEVMECPDWEVHSVVENI